MRKILLSPFLRPALPLLAQAPDIQWQKSFGGSSSEDGLDVELTPDGGYIMVGKTIGDVVDVAGLAAGIDVLESFSGAEKYTQKFIKQ